MQQKRKEGLDKCVTKGNAHDLEKHGTSSLPTLHFTISPTAAKPSESVPNKRTITVEVREEG